MTDYINLIIPYDWQIRVQVEAVDGYAARMAEARRYGAMAVALEAAQAEVTRIAGCLERANAQTEEFERKWYLVCDERDAALARLAEIEKQEPAYLLTPDGKCYAYGSAQPLSAGHADATLLELYAAAGASPMKPSESAEHRDELAKRKPEPAAETVGGLAKAVKAARGGDAPPAPMRRFA